MSVSFIISICDTSVNILFSPNRSVLYTKTQNKLA